MKLAYIIMLALVLVLSSCGKSSSTANVTKESSSSTPITAISTDKPVETTPSTDSKPVDTDKVGVEAAASFSSKYCNYKYGALTLQLNAKKESVKALENQKDKDGRLSEAVKQDIAKASTEVQDIQKAIDALQSVCKSSKLGDQCTIFQKDIQSNIDMFASELKDDKVSLDKWNQKLKEAQDASKITDLTIAKAKVEKIAPRIQSEENQVGAFNTMLEDLKGFC
ncbi:MAG: hypothetical protein AABX70_02920 [Nanoarchaeota archaeon]